MRLNTSIVIAIAVLVSGYFFEQSHLWIPVSVLGAGVADLFMRGWVLSDRLGEWRSFSMLLKFFVATIGFYAILGQIACLILVGYWIFF